MTERILRDDSQSSTLVPQNGAVEFTFDSKAHISDEFLQAQKQLKYIPCPGIKLLRRYETPGNDPFAR